MGYAPMPPQRPIAPAGVMRDDDFDAATEAASRSLAARFAPRVARGPARPSVSETAGHLAGALVNGVLGGLRRDVRRSGGYQPPPPSLLSRAQAPRRSVEQLQAAQRGVAGMLIDVLGDFGIKGEMRDIRPGPVVTLFEFEPARGTKSSRVIGLADDIARHMSASAVRIAVVPGRSVIGIELPNVKREMVELGEMLESEAFCTSEARLPVTLGKTIGGEPVVADLARMPHLLVAGTTGSGKSVGVNAMIVSLLYRLTPAECRFVMIDPKMLELSVYNGIPHLLAPVVTDPHKAVAALNWVVGEMEERYRRMAGLNVRNIEAYNGRIRKGGGGDAPMPYIVVVVDEFADLMAVAGKDIELAVQRIAQMARAAGIHLIMATQRPSVDIVTGTIKANFPTRMSFRVASKIDSRTILNETGAEQLLGQGDMLYAGASGAPVRLHAPFVSDEDVEAVVRHLREQAAPVFAPGLLDDTDGEIDDAQSEAPAEPRPVAAAVSDDLYERALAIVLRDQKASTSYLQRRLQIGYNRAADLMERMEIAGIVGPANHAGKRAILSGVGGEDTATA
jgi:S-DNA-T family DNA segregation ATPase FtsK/SpoIIIE